MWYWQKTLQRLSQKTFHNYRVPELEELCVQAKKGHVRLVRGSIIPLNFLPLASSTRSSCHLYVFDSPKVISSTLRWACRPYLVITRVYAHVGEPDEFVRAVTFAKYGRVYQFCKTSLIIK